MVDMMAVKTDTREEILRKASRLLQLNGFNGFSYGHIAKELGIKTAAVHYHFPSKEDLGIALVHRFQTRYRLWMEDGAELSAVEQLRGFFAIYHRMLEHDGRACPAGVLQAELNTVPDRMKLAVREMVEEVHGWLAKVLEQGRNNGELSFVGPPDSMAAVVTATVQGGVQLARSLGPERYHETETQLWRLLTNQ